MDFVKNFRVKHTWSIQYDYLWFMESVKVFTTPVKTKYFLVPLSFECTTSSKKFLVHDRVLVIKGPRVQTNRIYMTSKSKLSTTEKDFK